MEKEASRRELKVSPKGGVGTFRLHKKLSEMITELQESGGEIGHVDCVFEENSSSAIYLYVKEQGLKLRFNGLTQSLELIEILYGEKQSQKRSLVLVLHKSNLNRARDSGLLTFEFVCNLMGQATYPYVFINEANYILLKYEGICFLFENLSKDNRVKQSYVNKCKLYKIAIYAEDNLEVALAQLPVPYPVFEVVVGRGLELSSAPASAPKSIYFGDELDYVLSILKNPQKVYPLPLADSQGKGVYYRWNKAADIVLNYFSYGLDVVINGDTHKVKKFILHTNFPGHPLFNFYDRCFFYIELG